MANEEDNFDIDIYGDGGEDYQEEGQVADAEQTAEDQAQSSEPNDDHNAPSDDNITNQDHSNTNNTDGGSQKIGSTDNTTVDALQVPKHAPQTQGLKRRGSADHRPVDQGATAALFVSELHWWITDDDIRGWANQSECEDELEEITFSEHKVNGKSKGQVYVLFSSPQAASATKRKIESFGDGQTYRQKFSITFTNQFTNPFKTLPKDGNARNNNQGNRSASGGFNSAGAGGQGQNNFNPGGFRGGRGSYNNNRGGMPNMGGYSRGGFQQPMPGSYQSPMNTFQNNPMGGMPPYGGFQNRGGMMGGMRGNAMGMRGGRGGMSPNGMMGIPMGGMNMGGMPGLMGNMGMSMPQMNGSMGMQGFQNPGFFPQQGAVGDSNWNPHGAKRTRQE